jgi:CheY-like chemotaxis protein
VDVTKVLLVNDDESALVAMVDVLERSGYAVTCATNLTETLETICSTSYDALLTNFHLSRARDGLMIVNALRSVNPSAVILLLGALPQSKPQRKPSYYRRTRSWPDRRIMGRSSTYSGIGLQLGLSEIVKSRALAQFSITQKSEVLATTPASAITEISYGQDVHCRVGTAIGVAVVSLGIGALMLLSKPKTHIAGSHRG